MKKNVNPKSCHQNVSPNNKPCHQNGSPGNNFDTNACNPEQTPSPKLNTQNKPCHENTAPRTKSPCVWQFPAPLACLAPLYPVAPLQVLECGCDHIQPYC